MRMNIYVPDDLAEQVKAIDDVNVSAICQRALREEMERRQVVASLGKDMERIELWTEDLGDAAFYGKQVGYESDVTVYFTRRGRFASHDDHGQRLEQFDTFDEFARAFKGRPELVAQVADGVGRKHVTELDI